LNVISQTAEYALRSVVYLGSQAGQPVTTQRIAAATQVPVGYLSKVLQALGRAGLVDAQRGLRGGYVLARALDDLTILDVINAVDPLERINRCPLGLAAHAGSLCSLHRRLDEAIALIESLFRQTTVEQLLAERGANQNPMCEIIRGVEVVPIERAAAPSADGDGLLDPVATE
jgi:Rrf2 family transcriptional regulator, nitric oxide-sensitive transcriptional repressor